MSYVRYERLPAFDIPTCRACASDDYSATVAWVDHVTGQIEYLCPGEEPGEAGPIVTIADRQHELDLTFQDTVLRFCRAHELDHPA